jgi:DNA polymerase I
MFSSKKLIVIDCNSIIHRAYHALPFLSTKKGEPTNAIYGFFLVFFKAIKDFDPDFIVPTFDFPAPTFRHKKYKQYKAKRVKAPQELYDQIPKVKKSLSFLGLPFLEKKGYEADDLIGTISKIVSQNKEITTIIISGDTDILQLVDSNTYAYMLRRGVKDTILYDKKLVKEKYKGLSPSQLVDLRALKGDSSDNIPGVPGIGEKTAIDLLSNFVSLDNLYREIEENSIKAEKIRLKTKELLKENKKLSFLSKELATIDRNVPLRFNLENCRWGNYDKEKAIKFFKEFEFYAILNKISGEVTETAIK